MKTAFSTSAFGKFISLASLLGAMACSGGDGNSDETQNPINGANAQCDDEDEAGESPDGADDKITCSVDGDCDSDETCVDGLCTGIDGEEEDDACEDDEDDDEGADKIVCATDADCDSDEYCSNALCTGVPEPCASDADCDSDEACTNGLCEDR